MQRFTKIHRSLAAGTLVAAALAGATAQRPPELTPREITLRDGKTIAAEFGHFAVPENRAKPGSRTIELAVLRVRSPRKQPGLPVFVLAGGPGGSSIDLVTRLVRGGGPPLLELLGGDVVGIDQRGVGQSRPNLETPTLYAFDPSAPGDPQAQLAVMTRVCRAEAARWQAQGVDLAGYTTAESADDLDAVRHALGYPQIALWGESYGTHLALATIRRHGASIARAVLVGPEGPDHTLKLPSYAQRGLERLAALVRREPALAERLPDLLATLTRVLDELAQAPVTATVDGVEVGISKFDVQWLLANEIGLVRRHLERVPALIAAMARGDFTELARDLLRERREAGVGSAMQMAMDSASGASPARRAAIAKERATCLLGDAVNFPFPDIAVAWPVPDLGESFRSRLRSDVPVLILVGDLDSRTPLENATELLRDLPRGHLIEVANAGHDLNWMQPEARTAWSEFLAGKPVTTTRVAAPAPKFVPLPE